MYLYRSKHIKIIRIIAMVVVCLFTINTVVWTLPSGSIKFNRNTLAVQWQSAPIVPGLIDENMFRSLQDSGINVTFRMKIGILEGLSALIKGKTYSAVNGMLIGKGGAEIKFLPGVEYSHDGNTIKARFVVKGREDTIFEADYNSADRVFSAEREEKTSTYENIKIVLEKQLDLMRIYNDMDFDHEGRFQQKKIKDPEYGEIEYIHVHPVGQSPDIEIDKNREKVLGSKDFCLCIGIALKWTKNGREYIWLGHFYPPGAQRYDVILKNKIMLLKNAGVKPENIKLFAHTSASGKKKMEYHNCMEVSAKAFSKELEIPEKNICVNIKIKMPDGYDPQGHDVPLSNLIVTGDGITISYNDVNGKRQVFLWNTMETWIESSLFREQQRSHVIDTDSPIREMHGLVERRGGTELVGSDGLKRSGAVKISEKIGILSIISSADKSDIDRILRESDNTKLIKIGRSVDAYIHDKGGLKNVKPGVRYVYFRILQNEKVCRALIGELKAISESSRSHLRSELESLPHEEKLDFSDVAISIFSGMVEDGSFYGFCEQVQNNDPSLLRGTPNVVLVDSPGLGANVSTGLYRIASFLSLFGVRVKVISPGYDDNDIFSDKEPQIIGKRFITAKLTQDVEMIDNLKKRFPNSFIVAGGHEVRTSDRIFDICTDVDCVVKRLGEAGMTDIAMEGDVENGKLTEESRKRILEILKNVHTPVKPAIIKPLSESEMRALFQSYNPRLLKETGHINPINYVMATSHCGRKCIFCMARPFMTDSVRGSQKIVRVKAEDIIERLKRIRKYLPGARWIYFADDNFFNKQKWADEILDRIKEEKLDKSFLFTYTVRLDSLKYIPDDLLKKIAENNGKMIAVGVESTIPRIVKSLGKGDKIAAEFTEKFGQIMKKIKTNGIPHAMAFMILFTPEETLDDSIKIMSDVIKSITKDHLTVSLTQGLSMFPGTELYDDFLNNKLDATTVTINGDNGPVKISANALPHDPENRRLVMRIMNTPATDSIIYKNNLDLEYGRLKERVLSSTGNIMRQYTINTDLTALYNIHVDLLLIADLFLERRYQVLKMVDELRYRRDKWLSKVLSERSPAGAISRGRKEAGSAAGKEGPEAADGTGMRELEHPWDGTPGPGRTHDVFRKGDSIVIRELSPEENKKDAGSVTILPVPERPDEWASEQRRLFDRIRRYVKGPSVNMYIDLSNIPDEKGQLKTNIATIARLIAWHNTYGLNIRYILENDRNGEGLRLLKEEIYDMGDIPGIDSTALLKRIGIDKEHKRKDVIKIRLENIVMVKNRNDVGKDEYIVALKDNTNISGVAVPNYANAATMGLSLAALKVLWNNLPEKITDGRKNPDKSTDEWEKYEKFREMVMGKFRNIFDRYRVNLIDGKSRFSDEELEMMLTGSSERKLYYAVLYALPPMVKNAVAYVNRCQKNFQFMLQSA